MIHFVELKSVKKLTIEGNMRITTVIFIFGYVILSNVNKSDGFWWPFSTKADEPTQLAETSLEKMFAPFEITEVETKFLSEASHYLGNLPKLDQCNLLVINRLRSTCNKLSEVDVSKLSVNLLNCQSSIEGRRVFPCTEEMSLSSCTKDMDADTWNAYHVVSNRARAVCYSVRQTEFRIKTEITINALANSARDNLASLKHLLEGQEDLSNKTSETIERIIDGNKNVIKVQNELSSQQSTLKNAINDNINSLTREKMIIASRQEIMMKHSREVKNDLVRLAGEVQRNHVARKNSDKELLAQVELIQDRAKDVLERLDEAVKNMDNHYVSIEQRHGKIIENVRDIQKAINFVSELIINFEETFHDQMKWINDAVGGTRDRLSVISILLGHIVHFSALLVGITSVGSSLFTRTALLVLFPLNCIFALQDKKHFNHKELAAIIALSYPVNWAYCIFEKIFKKQQLGFVDHEKFCSFFKEILSKLLLKLRVKSNTKLIREENAKGCEELDMTYTRADESIITSTPQRTFKRQLYTTEEEVFENDGDGSSTPRRCGSLTKTGQRCKSYCKRGSIACSRHENSYNSYFEESVMN